MVRLEFYDPSGTLEVTQPHAPRAGAQRARELRALLQGIESASSIRPLVEKLRA